MGKKDPRVDAYIAKSAPFAGPILNHLRRLIHGACPEVEETIKWGFPHFVYHGILCSMAAFKQHCAFGFWHGAMRGAFRDDQKTGNAMGQFGCLTSTADLPKDELIARYIRKAMKLNATGIALPAPARPKRRKSLSIPGDLLTALAKNKKALASFDNFSPSHKREYVEWLTEAKRDETRQKRLQTALKWIAQGKPRNWKYMKK